MAIGSLLLWCAAAVQAQPAGGTRDHAASTPTLSQLKQGRALLEAGDLPRARGTSRRPSRAIPPPPKLTSCWGSSGSARRISPRPPLRIPGRSVTRHAWPRPAIAWASCWGSRAGRAEAHPPVRRGRPTRSDALRRAVPPRRHALVDEGFRRRASTAAGRRHAAARSCRSPLLSRPDASTATDGWSPRSSSCEKRSA